MSTTPHRPESVECSHPDCPSTYPLSEDVNGHCSRECALRHRGYRLLELIKHDHRFCYTCFARLKEVDPIPEEVRRNMEPVVESAATGYQYRTEHAQLGEVARRRDEYQFDTKMGTICECGNANTREREDVIREQSSIKTTALQLHRALTALKREGQHNKDVDLLALAEALRDQEDDDSWDFELAVGAAIQTDDA